MQRLRLLCSVGTPSVSPTLHRQPTAWTMTLPYCSFPTSLLLISFFWYHNILMIIIYAYNTKKLLHGWCNSRSDVNNSKAKSQSGWPEATERIVTEQLPIHTFPQCDVEVDLFHLLIDVNQRQNRQSCVIMRNHIISIITMVIIMTVVLRYSCLFANDAVSLFQCRCSCGCWEEFCCNQQHRDIVAMNITFVTSLITIVTLINYKWLLYFVIVSYLQMIQCRCFSVAAAVAAERSSVAINNIENL